MLRNIMKYTSFSKRYCHNNSLKEPPLSCCKLSENMSNNLKKPSRIQKN